MSTFSSYFCYHLIKMNQIGHLKYSVEKARPVPNDYETYVSCVSWDYTWACTDNKWFNLNLYFFFWQLINILILIIIAFKTWVYFIEKKNSAIKTRIKSWNSISEDEVVESPTTVVARHWRPYRPFKSYWQKLLLEYIKSTFNKSFDSRIVRRVPLFMPGVIDVEWNSEKKNDGQCSVIDVL